MDIGVTKQIGFFAGTLFSALILSACAPIEPVSISGPSGNQAYTMKCSGMGRTIEMCYQKAGEVCPNGYDVVGRSNKSTLIPGNAAAGTSAMLVNKENLTVECN